MNLFFTKTFWSGMALIISGVVASVTTGDYTSGVDKIIAGFGLIFIRDAIQKLN